MEFFQSFCALLLLGFFGQKASGAQYRSLGGKVDEFLIHSFAFLYREQAVRAAKEKKQAKEAKKEKKVEQKAAGKAPKPKAAKTNAPKAPKVKTAGGKC